MHAQFRRHTWLTLGELFHTCPPVPGVAARPQPRWLHGRSIADRWPPAYAISRAHSSAKPAPDARCRAAPQCADTPLRSLPEIHAELNNCGVKDIFIASVSCAPQIISSARNEGSSCPRQPHALLKG